MRKIWIAMVGAALVLTACSEAPDLNDEAQVLDDRCGDGDVTACDDLAVMLLEGRAILEAPADESPGPLNITCEDDIAAAGNLGECLRQWSANQAQERDDADRQNRIYAARYFRRSCQLGEARACFDYGILYSGDNYISANPVIAMRYYNIACNGGWAFACSALHDWTRQVPRSESAGTIETEFDDEVIVFSSNHFGVLPIERLQTACEEDDSGACLSLGARVIHGEGVEANEDVGLSHIQRACALGAEYACNFRSDVE